MNSKQKGLLASAAVLVVAVLAVFLIGKLSADPKPAPDGARATATATGGTAATTGPAAQATSTKPRATTPAPPDSGLKKIKVADLPAEGRNTLALIDQGGPFPYKQDGVIFENRERRLPQKPGGYYHEYTVVTPGEGDRGARRLITGDGGDLYYTADHYGSFQQVLR
ncbi:ribonuclease domain-containing protein [Longispora sp. NPDC051575]|uniref:ribonuclease domain-containing protein n=1 Tax=Longispora sp. NPDC051575 TaxID=3154943 RepID=UPI00342505D4